jgi:hypothetical protein
MLQRSWLCLICLIGCSIYGRTAFAQRQEEYLPNIHLHSVFRDANNNSHGFPDTGVRTLSLIPADSLHRVRFWAATGATVSLYAGTVIALNEAWYKQFPRSSFHLFDDWGEWRNIDKMGHLYTSYFESLWAYKIARWTGLNDNTSIWTGVAMGIVFQGTVEVLDGFSEEWGFSIADLGFDLLGSGGFMVQQKIWNEQRVLIKVSSTPVSHPDFVLTSTDGMAMMSLSERTDALFGRSYAERFLKDYNAQTTWLSVNVNAFLKPERRFPSWLNIAVGYGAENMYGGFRNQWEEDGHRYELSDTAYRRYSQFYLSPDIDFSRIPSRSPLLRTLLGMLNVFKVPGPVLEYNKVEGVSVNLRW